MKSTDEINKKKMKIEIVDSEYSLNLPSWFQTGGRMSPAPAGSEEPRRLGETETSWDYKQPPSL